MKDITMTVNIATEFSRFPGGRHETDGPYSGEGFLKQLLLPALEKDGQVKIILDGTMGYGSSFLEEAFGGLVRLKRWSLSDLTQKIQFVSQEDPYLIDEIYGYMRDANRE